MSVFAVEDEIEGFRAELLPEKDGSKILPTGRIIYENCLIPRENLIGDEGKGLFLALDAIDRGRVLLAGIACGSPAGSSMRYSNIAERGFNLINLSQVVRTLASRCLICIPRSIPQGGCASTP